MEARPQPPRLGPGGLCIGCTRCTFRPGSGPLGEAAMSLMTERERSLARAVSTLTVANPFLPERVEAERKVLGADFVAAGEVWHTGTRLDDISPNLAAIDRRVVPLAEKLRTRIAGGATVSGEDAQLYEDVALYVLYNRSLPVFERLIAQPPRTVAPIGAYAGFLKEAL